MSVTIIESSIHINAAPESVWHHITEVDITSFRHPTIFWLLGIPKPLRAEVSKPGVGGTRTSFFSNGLCFSQTITEWQPHERYAFTFRADPGFYVAYVLNLADGPFQMKAGVYQIAPDQAGLRLSLSSQYVLYGIVGMLLGVPVRLILTLFQKYLLQGIKANAERE